jgi:hypothetical protein
MNPAKESLHPILFCSFPIVSFCPQCPFHRSKKCRERRPVSIDCKQVLWEVLLKLKVLTM